MQEVQTTLPVGSIVNERYQVEDLLGRGGFGAVYLVRDLRVRQNVFALKEIIDPSQRERRHFTFEAEVLKRTDHPSLPRVYRAFDNPELGRAYMLMDYIEGSNLEKLRLKQPERRFALPAALALVEPIVEALAYLHTQQPPIIHRDIKPSNIIVPDSGTGAVLVDFGIAKEFDQEGTTTVIRSATPGYGAPEQYSAGTDIRTDVYGLGATLYTLLTGTIPVDAFFRMTQQMGKQVDPLPPVKQLVPSLPDSVSRAIERSMAPGKNERFATVNDFWAALHTEALAASSTLPDPPVSIVAAESPLNPSRRFRADPSASRIKWPVLALLLLLALGLGFAAALLALPHLRPLQTS
ncbi:MAG TPA: serine/threonine-protein kinase, partial [Ktedonobacteraceae bacterium]|nr:serine/threonine-protein kinase [Ktedonobacteraceae bacterium]